MRGEIYSRVRSSNIDDGESYHQLMFGVDISSTDDGILTLAEKHPRVWLVKHLRERIPNEDLLRILKVRVWNYGQGYQLQCYEKDHDKAEEK